jgi:hypothetical protein
MEVEEISLQQKLRMRGLVKKGLVEIMQHPETREFIVIIGKASHKRGLVFNLPAGLWRMKGSKAEVSRALKDFLDEMILVG